MNKGFVLRMCHSNEPRRERELTGGIKEGQTKRANLTMNCIASRIFRLAK